MTRLQAVENGLKSISSAAFQDLCDSFLLLRNKNYSAFARIGSQSGKQQTVKGTPDTLLLLPNGKYILIEYSTNKTAGLSKLVEDIKKCLEPTRTGIAVEHIAEMIICINFNLSIVEINRLKDLLIDTRIALTIYTLDSLALELYLNHRDLSHQYLGLALDTGQIVSIERFIEEYKRASAGISTPLDNTFLHREAELKEIIGSILQSDFIIITGPPGVGKTRLSIEALKSFLSENISFRAYCVSYKNHTLLEDLYQYLNEENDYLLFVDDANRIDAFSQIIGFYKTPRKGKLKIIITVRDYAFQEIGILVREFLPRRIDVGKFSDEQLKDIIKANPFGISNFQAQNKILSIADGNPRLAIMAALLALEQKDIQVLNDVAELFETYFSTFVKDQDEFAKELNIKCLALIAFFYTIPYKNKQITTSILDTFNIDYHEFIEAIDRLEKLELVEIQYEHLKIPEQNLATFFFYRAFIKDNLLPFEILLRTYFDANVSRFTDCVIPANNMFGYEEVRDKLKPELQKYWKTINDNDDKAYTFLNTFWYYLPTESKAYIFNKIEALPEIDISKYNVSYDNNAFAYNKNKLIELLGEFFRYPQNLKEMLELAFEFTRKSPDQLPELIHKIRETLTFDENDLYMRYSRQTILYDILLGGLNRSNQLLSFVFFELSKTFLSYSFHHTKGGRNHSFVWYDYAIPNIQPIQDFRRRIWSAIDSHFDQYPNESLELLQNYGKPSPHTQKEIMEFDVPFLLDIFQKHLTNSSFEHCKYVQDQIRWYVRNSVLHPDLSRLAKRFTNKTYEIYLKIDWDRFRDKEAFEFDDYRGYEKLKEAEIRSSFVFNSLLEINAFYETYVYLKKIATNDWNYNTVTDYIIDENCLKNFNLGCKFLELIIEHGNEINYIPRSVFQNQLKTTERVSQIWNMIHGKQFKNNSLWELSFYDFLDDKLISKSYADSLRNTIRNIHESYIIHFDKLERFLAIEPDLFQDILELMVKKNETEGIRLQVWMDFFSVYFDKLGNDFELIKKAYLQQDKIQSHYDHEGKGLLKILTKEPAFLVEYVKSLYSEQKFPDHLERRNLGFVWRVEGIQTVLLHIFDFVIEQEPYLGILDHFCNSFFYALEGEIKEKATNFLFDYCTAHHKDYSRMNIVVDIARHSMTELFEDVLLLFLTLNQEVKVFSKILWRGSGTSGVGDVILSDIEAAEWRNILSIVEKSNVGIALLPIKKYLNERIESCLISGDWERQRRFLERY